MEQRQTGQDPERIEIVDPARSVRSDFDRITEFAQPSEDLHRIKPVWIIAVVAVLAVGAVLLVQSFRTPLPPLEADSTVVEQPSIVSAEPVEEPVSKRKETTSDYIADIPLPPLHYTAAPAEEEPEEIDSGLGMQAMPEMIRAGRTVEQDILESGAE